MYTMRLITLLVFTFSSLLLMGQNQQAIDSLENLLEDHDETEAVVDHIIELTALYHRVNYDRAEELSNDALEIAKKLDYKEGVANATYHLSRVALSKREYNKVIEIATKAMRLSEDCDYRRGVAISVNSIGLANWRLGNLNQALADFAKALKIYHEIDDVKGIAGATHNSGLIQMGHGDYSKAAVSFLMAARMNEKIDNKLWLSYNYNSLGNVALETGRYNDALKHFYKTIDIKEALQDSITIPGTVFNIGIVHWNMKNPELAEEYYRKALAGELRINNKYGIAQSYNALGVLCDESSRYDEAVEYYEKAIAIFNELDSKKKTAEVYCNLAVVTRDQGHYQRSWDYTDKAFLLYTEMDKISGLATCAYTYGAFYLEQNLPEESIQHFQQALALGDSIGSKKGVISALKALAVAHRAMGNPKIALEFIRRRQVETDSLFGADQVKELGRLEANYEFQKGQKIEAAARMKVEKQEFADRNRKNNLQYSITFILILILFGGVALVGFIKVPTRFAEGLIFFSFLILFEFLLVLADPTIEALSQGAPGYKLLFNAALAGFIFPAHAFFERMLVARMMNHPQGGYF